MRGRTASKRRCNVYPVLYPTPSNSLLNGRSWMKISFSVSIFFLFLLFLFASQWFCYPHWPTAVVRSAIFPFLFLPQFFFFFVTLPSERAGGCGFSDRKWPNLSQCAFRAPFTHTTAGNDRFREKMKRKKRRKMFTPSSPCDLHSFCQWFRWAV